LDESVDTGNDRYLDLASDPRLRYLRRHAAEALAVELTMDDREQFTRWFAAARGAL
jgi:hypothetical protein